MYGPRTAAGVSRGNSSSEHAHHRRLLAAGRFLLAPQLTAPALQTWATVFVAVRVQALPILVFGVALSAAITEFV